MSQRQRIKTAITDAEVLALTCASLNLDQPTFYENAYVGGKKAKRAAFFKIDKTTVEVDLEVGVVSYPDYAGTHSFQTALDSFKHAYASLETKQAALKNGYVYQEEQLPDQWSKITIEVEA